MELLLVFNKYLNPKNSDYQSECVGSTAGKIFKTTEKKAGVSPGIVGPNTSTHFYQPSREKFEYLTSPPVCKPETSKHNQLLFIDTYTSPVEGPIDYRSPGKISEFDFKKKKNILVESELICELPSLRALESDADNVNQTRIKLKSLKSFIKKNYNDSVGGPQKINMVRPRLSADNVVRTVTDAPRSESLPTVLKNVSMIIAKSDLNNWGLYSPTKGGTKTGPQHSAIEVNRSTLYDYSDTKNESNL